MLSKSLLAIGVISVMGLLSAIFSGSKATAAPPAPGKVMAEVYRVDLSGNQLVFQIPQTYSLEMLTDPVTPSVNLFEEHEKATGTLVARRWWDFDQKKFFGKENLGHMVVTARIHHQAAHESSDFFLRNELITYIYADLLEQHQERAEYEWEHGDTSRITFVSNHPEHYETKVINGNNWLFYMLTGPEMTGVYVLPITAKTYLEFSFTRYFSPNIARSEWYRVYEPAQVLEDGIMSKVILQYAEGKPIGQISDDSKEANYQPLKLPPFIRPEGYSPEQSKLNSSE